MPPAKPHSPLTQPTTKNRFLAALIHVDRYSGRFHGVLARDTGLTTTQLRNILWGRREPGFTAAMRIAEAISRHAPAPIPLGELIVDATAEFPTPHICELFGCKCLPPWASRGDGSKNPRFEGVPPGHWTFAVSVNEPLNPNEEFYG